MLRLLQPFVPRESGCPKYDAMLWTIATVVSRELSVCTGCRVQRMSDSRNAYQTAPWPAMMARINEMLHSTRYQASVSRGRFEYISTARKRSQVNHDARREDGQWYDSRAKCAIEVGQHLETDVSVPFYGWFIKRC